MSLLHCNTIGQTFEHNMTRLGSIATTPTRVIDSPLLVMSAPLLYGVRTGCVKHVERMRFSLTCARCAPGAAVDQVSMPCLRRLRSFVLAYPIPLCWSHAWLFLLGNMIQIESWKSVWLRSLIWWVGVRTEIPDTLLTGGTYWSSKYIIKRRDLLEFRYSVKRRDLLEFRYIINRRNLLEFRYIINRRDLL